MTKKDPLESLRDTVVCITSAAKLHLSLGQHSSEPAVVAAMQWQYGLGCYEAEEVYKAALQLLDEIPAKRR